MEEKSIALAMRRGYAPKVLGSVQAAVQARSTQARWLQSAATLGAWWSAAAVAVFIPLLHFLLVPLLSILGLVFAIKKHHQTVSVEVGTWACPECRQSNLQDRAVLGWPVSLACRGCGTGWLATP